MNVVWHDNEFIQFHIWKTLWECQPLFPQHFTRGVWMNRRVDYSPINTRDVELRS